MLKHIPATFVRKAALAIVVVTGLVSIVGSGGPRYVVRPSQTEASASNSHFTATLSPRCSGTCDSFLLTVVNKTSNDLEIDWNKTLYIASGSTSGGFMFDGIVYLQRNSPKQPDIVFAKSSMNKIIFPIILVEYDSGRYGGWRHSGMPVGENGIYLNIRAGSEEIREKITINLVARQVQ